MDESASDTFGRVVRSGSRKIATGVVDGRPSHPPIGPGDLLPSRRVTRTGFPTHHPELPRTISLVEASVSVARESVVAVSTS
jgi:hypothetical protein